MMGSLRGVKSWVTEMMTGAEFAALVRGVRDGSALEHDHDPDHGDEIDGPVFEPDPLLLDSPVGAPPEGKGGGKKDSGGATSDTSNGGGKGKTGKAPTDITLSNSDIDENSAAGATVGQLGAVDRDKNESFTYTLLDDGGGLFAIEGDMLVVADGAVIDYESATSHQVTIQVTDKYGNTYWESVTISVNDLLDTPNNAPTDLALSASAVDENAAAGTIVGALNATDPDANESFTYTLLDDAGGRFAIVGGELVVADGAVLDFESDSSHFVTIQVTDSRGATYKETFEVTLNDIDESVNSAPTDIVLSGSAIIENAADGTVIGQLDCVDPDAGDSHSFSLVDDAAGRFAISDGKLVVANGAALDFESATQHSVTIRVTDSFGATYDKQFIIDVSDVDETPAEKPYYVSALVPQATNGEEYYRWNYGEDVGTGVTVTFTFLSGYPGYYDPYNLPYTSYTEGAVPFEAFTSAQVTVAYQILGAIADFADVTFIEVDNAAEADITFGAYYMDAGIGAFAYYAGGGSFSGDVWMNTRYDQYPSTSEDGGADWARSALAHEIGHAMGLRHPGDYNAGSGGSGELYLPDSEDNAQYSIMSYTDFPYSSYDPLDYMLYDIAALQYLYGANMTHATGDDLYLFDETADYIDTIWDAGGFDTFSAAGAIGDVILDLNDGAFSSVGLNNNIGLAFGAEIEAAIGGAGDDILIANALDNTLTGGLGADKFVFQEFGGFDLITDFEDGTDWIDLSMTSLVWGDLSFLDEGTGVEIGFDGSVIEVAGVSASQITADDFIFASMA